MQQRQYEGNTYVHVQETTVEMDSGEGCLWAAFGSRNLSRKRVRISTVRQRLQNQDRLNPAVRYGGVHMDECPLVNSNPSGQGFRRSFDCPLGYAPAVTGMV
jgi:hypothetical protein